MGWQNLDPRQWCAGYNLPGWKYPGSGDKQGSVAHNHEKHQLTEIEVEETLMTELTLHCKRIKISRHQRRLWVQFRDKWKIQKITVLKVVLGEINGRSDIQKIVQTEDKATKLFKWRQKEKELKTAYNAKVPGMQRMGVWMQKDASGKMPHNSKVN